VKDVFRYHFILKKILKIVANVSKGQIFLLGNKDGSAQLLFVLSRY